MKLRKRNYCRINFPSRITRVMLSINYEWSSSFSVGIQVFVVQINSQLIRQTALVHSLLAFALNTFVVALTINLIAGLTK